MWTKEEVLKNYHEDKAKLEAEGENAFFLASLLSSIGKASNMGDSFTETCKGLHRIMDKVSAAFTESLTYLEQFANFLEDGSQQEAEGQ